MNIELRNIKYHAGLSEETLCYEAVVYVDGKPAVDVSNRGHGGCDNQRPRKGVDMIAIEAAAKALKPADYDERIRGVGSADLGDREFPYTLEHWCGDQVSAFLIARDYRRAAKTKVLMLIPGKPGVRQVAWSGCKAITPAHIKVAAERYPDATILNTMPEAEALAIYSRAS